MTTHADVSLPLSVFRMKTHITLGYTNKNLRQVFAQPTDTNGTFTITRYSAFTLFPISPDFVYFLLCGIRKCGY